MERERERDKRTEIKLATRATLDGQRVLLGSYSYNVFFTTHSTTVAHTHRITCELMENSISSVTHTNSQIYRMLVTSQLKIAMQYPPQPHATQPQRYTCHTGVNHKIICCLWDRCMPQCQFSNKS